jgi:S1-C subfamily serine protease
MITLVHIAMAALAISSPTNGPAADASLVQVIVTTQESHPVLPWQRREPSMRAGYGVAIDGGLILTTEHLVRHSRLIELRRPRAGEKSAASLLIADSQINLAILRMHDSPDKPLPGLTVDGTFRRHPKLAILQFDETSEVQRGDAQTIQLMMAPLSGAPDSSLAASLLTDLNVNGEGAPVVVEGKLVGLMMSYSRGERVGHMVPGPVIAKFLDLVKQPNYPGFPSAGFAWSPLVDPVTRRYLGVTDSGRGVLVLSGLPHSGAGVSLQPNDVVLSWNGQPVDNMGFYTDPDVGRMELPCLVKIRGNAGDTVPVTIVRDRRRIDVDLRLAYRGDKDNLIPEDIEGGQVEYLLHCGLLIRELTGRYLQAGGAEWRQSADPRLTNIYQNQRAKPEKPGDRVVILSVVLPDPVNVGYQEFANSVVTRVNGKEVRNMRDVFSILDSDGNLTRVTLLNVGTDLVLDATLAAEANARIARNYGIPSLQFRADSGGRVSPAGAQP